MIQMIITVVGLGLIGGSVARRLKGFKNAEIRGFDKNITTIALAKKDGAIDDGFTEAKEAVNDSDFIILCLYPELNVNFIRDNIDFIKPGCVITDVSGVKEYVCDNMEKLLKGNIDFVGGHPMAGRETGGYESSTDTLFDNASFLMTPLKTNRPESIALVRDMAKYIGCKRVMTTTPHEHDEIIAYTSQLMHIVAVALCCNPLIERSSSFSAGSLRDCTRVALINEKMWSELFCENGDALVNRIDEMQDSLEDLKQAIYKRDRKRLEDIMRTATANKIKWLME